MTVPFDSSAPMRTPVPPPPEHPNRSDDRNGVPRRTFASLFEAITANVARVVQGKRDAIDLAVTCLLAEGHLLIEDVPGVGKTSLAKALAASIDCTWKRVQFTPDLLPTDLVGVSVLQRATDTFVFQPGPLFANIVLADEINRASPKTQSALLEAMEERQVSAEGRTYPLPAPFMVAATQNPVEQEGTYRLPESQLDRFLMRISLGYPGREAEMGILDSHGAAGTLVDLRPVVTAAEVVTMTDAVRTVHLADALKSYLVDIAETSRVHQGLTLGLSPRATLQLARATRARAASNGRDYAIPDDVKAVSMAVLSHRIVVRPDAASRGLTAERAIREIIDSVQVPAGR
jgi:MoxR-like ATPase